MKTVLMRNDSSSGLRPLCRLLILGMGLWLVAPPGALAQATEAATDAETPDEPAAATLEASPPAGVDARISREREIERNPFGISPHRPNYVLPLTYNNSPNREPYESITGVELDNWEIKFQFSFKVPIFTGLLDDGVRLFAAYTQQSYWQAYNSSHSSPFRETNHEPELMLIFGNDWEILGFSNRFNTLGLSHQSNGRSEPLSRSWNRIYAQFVFERENLLVAIKPWWRIPEDAEEDDNPDIDEYMGHAELQFLHTHGSDRRSLALRYDPPSGRGALQLGWSFPFSDKIKGYVQYFNGYGESLLDYDARTHRIGLGVLLTDWL